MTKDDSGPGGEWSPLDAPLQELDHPILWSDLLARNVRHFRTKRNVSQEVLAEQCGIYRTYLSRIETGRCNPSLSVLVALAAALGIMPHALLVPIE